MEQEIIPYPRRRKAHLIRVIAFDVNDKEIRNIRVDVGKEGKKDWLFDFILWATCNGIAIEIEKCL